MQIYGSGNVLKNKYNWNFVDRQAFFVNKYEYIEDILIIFIAGFLIYSAPKFSTITQIGNFFY